MRNLRERAELGLSACCVGEETWPPVAVPTLTSFYRARAPELSREHEAGQTQGTDPHKAEMG